MKRAVVVAVWLVSLAVAYGAGAQAGAQAAAQRVAEMGGVTGPDQWPTDPEELDDA